MSLQEDILWKSLQNNRLAQAYLISANGKEAAENCAKRFIQGVYCQNKTACGSCIECKRFLNGNQVDYLEFVKPKDKNLTIDEIRSRLPGFLEKKGMGSVKVVFFPDAHLLSEKIQNYLLKSVEEPQEGVLFVFTTHRPDSLLPTIISRCQWLRLEPRSRGDICEDIRGKVPDELVIPLASFSGGFSEQALVLARDEEWLALRTLAEDVAKGVCDSKRPMAEQENKIMSAEKRLPDLLEILASIFRDALYLKLAQNEKLIANTDMIETISLLAEHFTTGSLRIIIDSILKRLEEKRNFPGIKSKLLAEGLLLDIMEEKNSWQP